MEVSIARWGNSLGVRIPREIAGRLGLKEGVRVEIEAKGERVVISRARVRPRYALADLLEGLTPGEMHDAFDWGPDRGREALAAHGTPGGRKSAGTSARGARRSRG